MAREEQSECTVTAEIQDSIEEQQNAREAIRQTAATADAVRREAIWQQRQDRNRRLYCDQHTTA